ncbi:hypothetical protein C8F04DRAFT_1328189 [Mycena alexandri]|uniref:Zn(2)-C6 fungal-type domain-containing protein n=1 Tax=Mycena alexandri TaxID=1745969 RepID=A0AAD6S0K6_9AGAR|nr:hypothetical protein C8F04DRAFT_1328189 [Mycena alexandri]
MSDSTAAPFATQRRRTIIACKTCRRKKQRCVTSEHPPTNPCARCERKNLTCEYVSLASEAGEFLTDTPVLRFSPMPPLQRVPQAPQYAPVPPTSGSGKFPPPLPYTTPPPANHRPRYSAGAEYPDLTLSGPPSNLSQNYLPFMQAARYPRTPPTLSPGEFPPPLPYTPPPHRPRYSARTQYPDSALCGPSLNQSQEGLLRKLIALPVRHPYSDAGSASYHAPQYYAGSSRPNAYGAQTASGYQDIWRGSQTAAGFPPSGQFSHQAPLPEYGQMAIPPMPFFADTSFLEDEDMFNATNARWPPKDGGE